MNHRIIRACVLLIVVGVIGVLCGLFGRASGLTVPDILPASSRMSGMR